MRCASFISHIRVCTVIPVYNSSGREKAFQQISCVSDRRPSHSSGGRKQTLRVLALSTVGLLCTRVPPQALWGGQLLTLHLPFPWLPTSVLSFYFGAARESPSPPAKLAPIYLLSGAPLLVAAEPQGQYLLQWVGNVTLL